MDKDETKIKNETKTTKEIDWDEVDKEYEKHYTKKFYGCKRVVNAVKQKMLH